MPAAISPEQLAANRANATHSTGPATAEGKATSSRNRTTHGFRSSTVLLPGDDPAEYNQLLTELEDHFGEPVDLPESRFIREMADAEWRLRRIRAHMESAIARHMETLCARHPDFDVSDLQSRAMETLGETGCSYSTWLRYETKFERQYDRASNGWHRYQQDLRRAAATDRKTHHNHVLAQTSGIPQPSAAPAMGSNVQSPPMQSDKLAPTQSSSASPQSDRTSGPAQPYPPLANSIAA